MCFWTFKWVWSLGWETLDVLGLKQEFESNHNLEIRNLKIRYFKHRNLKFGIKEFEILNFRN